MNLDKNELVRGSDFCTAIPQFVSNQHCLHLAHAVTDKSPMSAAPKPSQGHLRWVLI